MEIKREELARSKRKEDLLALLEQKAQELDMGAPQGNNQHGPVYVSQQYDLRIEKEAGFGEFKLLLMHKLQPPRSLRDRLRDTFFGS